MTPTIADYLWGDKARFRYLFFAAVLLLFTLLGAKEIWTQEHRWADIVSAMFSREDFLHPYLGEIKYYDKPLLSYWLIVLAKQLTGVLNTWTLRLPSAIAGLLAIFSIYRLGLRLQNKQLGLLAGWLLLTTFYFVFWARVSSADMLNLAGSLLAVTWYMEHNERNTFFNYAVFFLILALTSLCKGLGGAIIPLIAVAIDLSLKRSWSRHLTLTLLLSIIPAVIIYLIPFIASSFWGGEGYNQNGLYLVYKENILRYFQPFDHQDPIYIYFIYLPIYLLPWALFLIPALCNLPKRWHNLSLALRWIVWTFAALFLFFTLSGSRRSYYILPIVPFAILLIADWALFRINQASLYSRRLAKTIMSVFFLLFIIIILLPAWYYSQFGAAHFAKTLMTEAGKYQSWDKWNIVLLDSETKLNFYLYLPATAPRFEINGKRSEQSAISLQRTWTILQNKPQNTIFVTRVRYKSFLQNSFSNYHLVEAAPSPWITFLFNEDDERPIAFIPS